MARGHGELYERAREKADPRAVAIHEDALVWDMTMPFARHYAEYDLTLPRFHAAGVDVVSLTVQNMPGADLRAATLHLGRVRAEIARRAAAAADTASAAPACRTSVFASAPGAPVTYPMANPVLRSAPGSANRSASDCVTRSMIPGIRSRTAASRVRTVPSISTAPGMTLWVVPPSKRVTERTTFAIGSVSRATTCCRFVTTCAPTHAWAWKH